MRGETRRDFLKQFFSPALLSLSSIYKQLSGQEMGRQGATKIIPAKDPARINPDFEPAHLKLHGSGELKKRGQALWDIMKECRLCPRECGANRIKGDRGFCQANSQLEVSSYHPHYGEERPLVGKGGSGTIFFTNCNLRCVFCINWEVSQGGEGSPCSLDDLADMMLSLQKKGATTSTS